MEEKALLPSAPERSQISTERAMEAPKRKKRGPKAPNPLSVKKKKVKTDDSNQMVGGKRKFEEEKTSHLNGDTTEEPGDGKPKRKRRKKVPVAETPG